MSYRRIDPRMWDDEKFVDLPADAKLVWLLLLTGPHTTPLPGLWSCSVGVLADASRLPVKTIANALRSLSALGMVVVDERARVIQVPNAPRYNAPSNDKQLRGWFAAWKALPECRAKYDHLKRIRESLPTDTEWSAKAWSCTFGTVTIPDRFATDTGAGTPPKPSPNGPDTVSDTVSDTRPIQQSSEQEQEQKQTTTTRAGARGPGRSDPGAALAGTNPSAAVEALSAGSEGWIVGQVAAALQLGFARAAHDHGLTVGDLRSLGAWLRQNPAMLGPRYARGPGATSAERPSLVALLGRHTGDGYTAGPLTFAVEAWRADPDAVGRVPARLADAPQAARPSMVRGPRVPAQASADFGDETPVEALG